MLLNPNVKYNGRKLGILFSWQEYTHVCYLLINAIIFSVCFDLTFEKKAIYFLIIYLDYLVFDIKECLPINPLRLLYSCTFHCHHNHE